jgi:hypothetical protein
MALERHLGKRVSKISGGIEYSTAHSASLDCREPTKARPAWRYPPQSSQRDQVAMVGCRTTRSASSPTVARVLPYLKPQSCAYLERVDVRHKPVFTSICHWRSALSIRGISDGFYRTAGPRPRASLVTIRRPAQVYDTPPPPSKALCFLTRNSIAQQVIICDIRIPGIRVTFGVIGRMTHVSYVRAVQPLIEITLPTLSYLRFRSLHCILEAPLPPVWLYGMAPQRRIGLPRLGVRTGIRTVLRGYHPRARTITRIRETIGEVTG